MDLIPSTDLSGTAITPLSLRRIKTLLLGADSPEVNRARSTKGISSPRWGKTPIKWVGAPGTGVTMGTFTTSDERWAGTANQRF
jgi:hypothetical protein